jgi:hypothetical protein
MQRGFKFTECLDLQASDSAEKRKFPHATVNILAVKNRQPFLSREARFSKGRDQSSQFCGAKLRLGGHGQLPQIQKRAVEPAFAAGERQRLERVLACLKIKVGASVKPDEFTRPNYL